MRKLLSLALLLSMTSACSTKPECPFHGEPDYALSAGCLALVHGKMLVVESRKGGLTPPGGKALPGESAQCAAHRETLEETGVDLIPRQLLAVFDTGFHLYHCEIHSASGGFAPRFDEVKRSFWLDIADFDKVTWRYPGQGEALLRVLEDWALPANAAPATGQENPL